LEISAAMIGTIGKQMIACGKNETLQTKVTKTLFIIGQILNMAVGPIVDAAAYAFAPQTIIAPFASLDVTFNALSSPFSMKFQNQNITWHYYLSAFLVTGGASCAALFAEHSEGVLSCEELVSVQLRFPALLYYAVEIATIAALIISLRSDGTHRVLVMAVVAGLLMGNTFLLKGFVDLVRNALDTGDWSAFANATPLVVVPYLLLGSYIACALLGNYCMTKALGSGGVGYVVTVFEGSHIVFSCLSGAVVMREMARSDWYDWVLYWQSVALIILGLLFAQRSSQEKGLIAKDVSPGASELSSDSKQGLIADEVRLEAGDAQVS